MRETDSKYNVYKYFKVQSTQVIAEHSQTKITLGGGQLFNKLI